MRKKRIGDGHSGKDIEGMSAARRDCYLRAIRNGFSLVRGER